MEQKSFPISFCGDAFMGHYITDCATADGLIRRLLAKDILFGVDTETAALKEFKHIPLAALSPHLSQVRLLQVFDGKNSIVFDLFQTGHIPLLKRFLSEKRFIAHNALFDLMFFKKMGIENMDIGCTLILARLLFHAVYPKDEGLSASLDNLVHSLLGVDISKQNQASDWSKPLTFEQIEYAALDAICVRRLAEKMASGLTKFGLERVYSLYKASQHPIASMQLNGLYLDSEAHQKLIPVWRNDLYQAKKEVLRLTGLEDVTPHTLASWLEKNLPKDVLRIWPRTEEEKLSTDADTLADFSHLEIVAPFSQYQEKKKLTSTYGNHLLTQINPKTGRIHAGYKICGARTGRLSSAHPNLQNLPRDAGIRANFRATGQNTFLCADYSQIELRVAAELSQDKTMLEAYRNGIDLHALTASKITNKRVEDVTKSERQMSKAFNFGLMFGLGKQKFAHYARKSYKIEISQQDAEEAIDTFRETYSGYRAWQLNQVEKTEVSLTATTACGKLRKFPKDNYYGGCLNQPVQGSAAEIMLYALVHLYKSLKLGNAAKLVNCVHDEILVECREEKECTDILKTVMVNSMTQAYLDVFPNGITRDLVEVKQGKNWNEAKS